MVYELLLMFWDLNGQTLRPMSVSSLHSPVTMKLFPDPLDVPCIIMPFIMNIVSFWGKKEPSKVFQEAYRFNSVINFSLYSGNNVATRT